MAKVAQKSQIASEDECLMELYRSALLVSRWSALCSIQEFARLFHLSYTIRVSLFGRYILTSQKEGLKTAIQMWFNKGMTKTSSDFPYIALVEDISQERGRCREM